MKTKAIGIMDSGLGGLTVMKALMKYLPNEDIIYLGDTLHCPYGTKKPADIQRYVYDIANFLVTKDIKMLILACNTATVMALPLLEEELSIPVIGMIDAASLAAIEATKTKRIGVIATFATVQSKKYTEVLKTLADVKVVEQACPTFVTIVEQGLSQKKQAYTEAKKVLAPLNKEKIDTLILGCTHFPMMKSAIQSAVKDVKLIDPAQNVAREAMQILEKLELLNPVSKKGNYELYITKANPLFKNLAKMWLGADFELKEVIVDETK